MLDEELDQRLAQIREKTSTTAHTPALHRLGRDAATAQPPKRSRWWRGAGIAGVALIATAATTTTTTTAYYLEIPRLWARVSTRLAPLNPSR